MSFFPCTKCGQPVEHHTLTPDEAAEAQAFRWNPTLQKLRDAAAEAWSEYVGDTPEFMPPNYALARGGSSEYDQFLAYLVVEMAEASEGYDEPEKIREQVQDAWERLHEELDVMMVAIGKAGV